MLRAALLVLPSATAWSTISQSRHGVAVKTIKEQMRGTAPHVDNPNQLLGYLWSTPADSASPVGLGGGIAWAWDPALCEQLKPGFREDILFVPFITCESLRAAVHRAFASWSDNHAGISFIDVTEECARTEQLNADCSLAEVWVTARHVEQNADSEQSVLVAASATPKVRYSSEFRNYNGQRTHATVLETHRAVLAFNVEPGFCWYLDSTFCSPFHSLKDYMEPEVVVFVAQIILFGLWAVALLLMAIHLWTLIRPLWTREKGCKDKLKDVMVILSGWSVLGTTVRVILICVPPIFFYLIFLPCWECYDFEAAATHEVGHILGLAHPDDLNISQSVGRPVGANVYQAQLAAIQRNQSTYGVDFDAADYCQTPWDEVREGVPPGAHTVEMDEGEARPSIMMAFTQHNPRVCLSEDDLEAIHVLYPDCSQPVTTPVCYKTAHNIGWVRLGCYILIPVLIALLLLMLLNAYVHTYLVARIRSANDLLVLRSLRLTSARSAATANDYRARRIKKELERQKLSEDERVRRRAHHFG